MKKGKKCLPNHQVSWGRRYGGNQLSISTGECWSNIHKATQSWRFGQLEVIVFNYIYAKAQNYTANLKGFS